jgi:carboxyl-terminal processing protease
MHKDSVTIIKPVANGPSARQELREIDFICRQNEAFEESYLRIVCFLDSKEKRFRSTVNYLSKIRKQKLTLNVKRDIIPLSSVDASLMINKTTAYKINLVETTFEEFRKALVQLKEGGYRTYYRS